MWFIVALFSLSSLLSLSLILLALVRTESRLRVIAEDDKVTWIDTE